MVRREKVAGSFHTQVLLWATEHGHYFHHQEFTRHFWILRLISFVHQDDILTLPAFPEQVPANNNLTIKLQEILSALNCTLLVFPLFSAP